MNKIHSCAAFLLFLIGSITLSSCAAIDSVRHTKKYVSLGEFDYAIYGRSEAADGYISFSSAGVSISFMQEEEELCVWMEDVPADPGKGGNWMNVVIADSVYRRIKLEQGKHLYQVYIPVNSTKFITLVKATESFVGEVRLYGLEASAPPRTFVGENLPRRIQFIGNSITCGYGNMVSIAPPHGNPLTGFHSENENAYQSYAMQTARRLKMEPMLVSFSGKGMYRNFDGDTTETMPKIYNRIHLQKKNSAVWDHIKQSPDVIVINLGTNDYYGESQNKPLNDSVFVQTYIQFVKRLVVYYPNTKIICANGSMLNDGWPEGKKCWSRIQANLKKVQEHFKAKGNTNIYTFFFTPQSAPYGEDYHPSLATHTKMAEELTTFIQTVVFK